jgi:hypothetical protein
MSLRAKRGNLRISADSQPTTDYYLAHHGGTETTENAAAEDGAGRADRGWKTKDGPVTGYGPAYHLSFVFFRHRFTREEHGFPFVTNSLTLVP